MSVKLKEALLNDDKKQTLSNYAGGGMNYLSTLSLGNEISDDIKMCCLLKGQRISRPKM